MANSCLKAIQKFTCANAATLHENLAMDLPSCSSDHPLQLDHGNNVAENLDAKFCNWLVALSNGSDWETLQRELDQQSCHLAGDGRTKPHFLLEWNEQNKCFRDKQVEVYAETYTRYFSGQRFYQLFVDPKRKNGILKPAEKKIRVDKFINVLSRHPSGRIQKRWLGTSPEELRVNSWLPKPIWVTPSRDAPHRQAGFQDLSESERLMEVVKRTALPGYTTESERKKNLGIIAVEFDLVHFIDLYKPTVLDAIDAPFFFPGPKGAMHGWTKKLNASLNSLTRENGVKEYICESFKVPSKLGDKVMVQKIGYF